MNDAVCAKGKHMGSFLFVSEQCYLCITAAFV